MSGGPDRAGLDAVAAALGDRAEADHPLGALTTYRVGGPAALWFEAGSVDDLLAVRRALAGTAVPVLVVGKGSNLLVADAGFFGLAVHLGPGLSGIEIGARDGPDGEPVEVSAGGGRGCRCWPGARSRPGCAGSSGRSASRARWAGRCA